MVALVAIVALADRTKRAFGPVLEPGESYSYDIDVAPKKISANARVTVRNGRGDITVRGSDSAEIRVTAKKTVSLLERNGCAANCRADQCDDRAERGWLRSASQRL